MTGWRKTWVDRLLATDLSAPTKIVGMVLAWSSNRQGAVTMAHHELVSLTSLQKDTARKAVRMLEAGGWVETTAGGGRGVKNSYALRPV